MIGTVAVLMGGTSSEREVSLNSGRAVLSALQSAGVDAFAIDLGVNRVQQLIDARFDTAFVIEHGGMGEDGRLQAILEAMGKPYTGPNSAACALAMDKQKTKAIWRDAGLPVADSIILTPDTDWADCFVRLGSKLMVKPVAEGSSVGNHIVHDAAQLAEAYDRARQYGQVMAETFIEGAEYTCAILNDQALPLIRIESQSGVYDYAAKYQTGDTQYHIPCGLDSAVEQQVQALALTANRVLGCDMWSRVDLIGGPDGFVLLEVNTVPGMTATSLVPKAAQATGLEFPDLCVRIAEMAHAR